MERGKKWTWGGRIWGVEKKVGGCYAYKKAIKGRQRGVVVPKP